MKLGGYFGLTAPMYVLFSDEFPAASFEYSMKVLDTAVNKELFKSFKVELLYLAKALTSIKTDYSLGNTSMTPFQDNPTYRQAFLQGGCVVGVEDTEDATTMLKMEVSNLVAYKLLQALEKSPNKYDYSFIALGDPEATLKRVYEILASVLNEDTVRINTKELSRKVLNKLKNVKGSSIKDVAEVRDNLCNAFSFSMVLPSKFKCGNEIITLDPDEYKILSAFYSKRGKVQQLISNININQKEEDTVFDLPFSTILGRRPNSLFYLVARKFDYAKNKNALFLTNVIKDTKREIDHLDQLMSTKVVCPESNKINDQVLSYNDMYAFFSDFDNEKQQFFSKLRAKGILVEGSIIQADLDLISDLYDLASKMTIEGINQKFNCNFTEESFNLLIDKFNKIGICGLNLSSLVLFSESIGCTPLASFDQLIKSQEEIDQYLHIISDVNTLLDTLIPIGVEINV